MRRAKVKRDVKIVGRITMLVVDKRIDLCNNRLMSIETFERVKLVGAIVLALVGFSLGWSHLW